MKIYVWINQVVAGNHIAYALSEDGTTLTSHVSSNPDWAKHDMGITGDWKHDIYAKHYPDGYKLEWVDDNDVTTHPGLLAAVALARSKKQDTSDMAKVVMEMTDGSVIEKVY
jgi:hypothetical protein